MGLNNLYRAETAAKSPLRSNSPWINTRVFAEFSIQVAGAGNHRIVAQHQIGAALAAGLPELKIGDYFNAKVDLFMNADLLLTAVDNLTGVIVGALAAKRHQDHPSFIHLSTLLIANAYQRTSVIRLLFRVLLQKLCIPAEGLVPLHFALKTYNPHSYLALKTFARLPDAGFYPLLRRSPAPDMEGLARSIAARLEPSCTFDVTTGVISGAAGGVPDDFYPSLPQTAHEAINEYFRVNMAPRDRLLCVLSLRSVEAAQRVFRAFGIP
jgi:hypothetical protein